MTNVQAAEAMRRLADVLEQNPRMTFPRPDVQPLEEECQVGAAMLLCVLRDSFTATPREVWRREEILVLLNALQSDPEIFSLDLVSLFDAE